MDYTCSDCIKLIKSQHKSFGFVLPNNLKNIVNLTLEELMLNNSQDPN